MILDARKGDCGGWTVYHCEECCVLKGVVWVDDEANQYGTYGAWNGGDSLPTITHQTRKIEIHSGRRLVLINPVEDEQGSDTENILAGLQA